MVDDGAKREPQTDLRASNNIVHIRTWAADSTVTLMDLIKYIAYDGDLSDANLKDDLKINSTNDSKDVCVHHLVEEAMNDTTVMPMLKPMIKVTVSSDEDVDEDYCILDSDMLVGYVGTTKITNPPQVHLLTREPIKMVDNHFSVPVSKVDALKAPKTYPPAVPKYSLRELTIIWHMYGGNDLEKNVSEKSTDESLSSNSADVYLPPKSSIDNINITYTTSKPHESQAINFVFPSTFGDYQKSNSFHASKNHTWQEKGGPGREHDTLMKLKLIKIRKRSHEKSKHSISIVLQLKMFTMYYANNNITVLHNVLYESEYNGTIDYIDQIIPERLNEVVIKATNIRPEPHINNLQECCLRVSLLPLRLNIDEDSLLFLINYFTEIFGNCKSEDTIVVKSSPPPVMNIENVIPAEQSSSAISLENKQIPIVSPNTQVSFMFSPEVPIRLDYQGKRVDLTRAPLAGLIMGLGEVEPMYSLVQLFHGIRDLFWLPIEPYQKDGRIVRGLQRGANSFTTSSAMAVLEITARLFYAIQPANIREGFATAIQLVKEGIGETAQTLVRVASVEHEVKGKVGAVGGVL
ncbi:hypothetical protein PGB90_006107 [Kerria lacca]